MRRSASATAFAVALIAAVVVATARGTETAPPSGPAFTQPPRYTALASQRIYFVLTDRYANGDPANDRGGLGGDSRVTGFEPADPGFFHGGDLKGLTGDCADPRTGLARIKSLGFTAVWLTPIVQNQVVQQGSAGYHGYWGLDFTIVDRHLGGGDDFARFVECAHSLGLKVYLDVVVNHTGDVIQLAASSFVPPSEVPYKDCHGKRFDPARYVNRTFPCMNAANMPGSPYVLPTQRNLKKPTWMNNVTNYHDRGNIDFSSCSDVCLEQGDFFGLDDLFTEKPVVWKGLAGVFGNWVKKYKLDGFRVDTARHVNAAFFRLWVPRILADARSAGVSDFAIFGEVFSTDDQYVSSFVRNRGLPITLDFPFQDAATGYVAGTTNARALQDRLADDDYWRTGNGVAPVGPTFLGNHDMGRAAYQILQHGGTTNLLQRVLLAYDLMYLMRGAPAVYYGDEVGMIGRGGDQQARQDMFPTQVDEWRTQERVGSPPIGTRSSFDVTDNPIEAELKKLGALRVAHPALSTGATIVRYASGRILVFSRIDAGAKREYLAAFNAGTTEANVTVRTSEPADADWHGLLGLGIATIHDDGSITLAIPPLTALLLKADMDIAVTPPAPPTVKVAGDDLSNMWRISAAVKGDLPVSVAFAVKRGSAAWTRIAVDDSPPYRAFLDPAKYRRNERVQVAAVVRGLDGATATSKVVPFRIRRR